jgi:hypothetical protein
VLRTAGYVVIEAFSPKHAMAEFNGGDFDSQLPLNAELFVHGSREGFGTKEEMAEALNLIPIRTELLEVSGAGHELLTKHNAEELPQMIAHGFRQLL